MKNFSVLLKRIGLRRGKSLMLAGLLIMGLMATFALGCAPYSRVSVQEKGFTKEDVIKLTKAGVGDDVIISQIEASKVAFKLSTEEILALREIGVSEPVMQAMIQSGSRAGTVRHRCEGRQAGHGALWVPLRKTQR